MTSKGSLDENPRGQPRLIFLLVNASRVEYNIVDL
jgi:hypothetical protein